MLPQDSANVNGIPGLQPDNPVPLPEPIDTCTDVFCIAEKQPVYNATSGNCECEWISGLEPKDTIPFPEPLKAEVDAKAKPKPGNLKLIESCRDIFCIAEKHPVYNATSGRCECEWIDGFGPASSKL
ncbi:hypothetical protein DID88_010126 [Monilinia fructigena]|uniref:Uncharacterized protein n=1 Tax=Monilinia fructigena TaxID=38457 RepID=A0A395IL81_9HELO|nr:hypothetical protein DID88_010126 [Monilinia fructigena]